MLHRNLKTKRERIRMSKNVIKAIYNEILDKNKYASTLHLDAKYSVEEIQSAVNNINEEKDSPVNLVYETDIYTHAIRYEADITALKDMNHYVSDLLNELNAQMLYESIISVVKDDNKTTFKTTGGHVVTVIID